MKRKLQKTLLLASLGLFTMSVSADDMSSKAATGPLVTIESAFTVEETGDKLSAIIKDKGLTEFARINHADNASKADLKLRPTQVIIFGNPKVGTPLMNCAQSIAIDLPQKMLIWQDEAGKVWLGYNNPEYLKRRHSVEGCDAVFAKVTTVLGALSKAATSQ